MIRFRSPVASLTILLSKPAVSGEYDPVLTAVPAAILICQIKAVAEGNRCIPIAFVGVVEGIEIRLPAFCSWALIRKTVDLR